MPTINVAIAGGGYSAKVFHAPFTKIAAGIMRLRPQNPLLSKICWVN
jgi:hypothetical protein